jgi:Domain of unknown function (DUF4291)
VVKLLTEPYLNQASNWPKTGRHILAQFDENTVVVYQAYRPAIGLFAAEHGYFGGEFSLNRMSWIKPNFLWMMYRSGWGTKPGQEVILAVWLKRSAFDEILASAIHSNIVNIEDISEFVQQQRQYQEADRTQLLTPCEAVYPVTDPDISQKLGLSVS